uniref:CNH domain-containing protein n=1 Tax=Neobodo designis TaxID=312471 RepID=A0A7S1QUM2_NEODS|mmetsp:Transcript_52466/g.161525  ORF Transcript_52466/g.161525 Transcript_52466/m.161525 type:complete len:1408 (+) Transcript_52466:46-4269(+)
METRCGVRLLAALYTFQGEGAVTALDTFGPNIYVGFESGTVQKLKIKRDSSGQIHTNLLLSASTGKKHKVKSVYHSDEDPLLFVLSHRRLVVLSSDDLSLLREIAVDVSAFTVSITDTSLEVLHQRHRAKQQQQQPVGSGSVTPSASAAASPKGSNLAPGPRPAESPRPTSVDPRDSPAAEPELRRMRSARGTSTRSMASPNAPPAAADSGRTSPVGMPPAAGATTDAATDDAAATSMSPRSPSKAAGAASSDAPKIHRVCCCLRDERRVVVYEFTYDRNLRPRKQARAAAQSMNPEGGVGDASFMSASASAVLPAASAFGIPPNGRLSRLSKEFLFPERVLSAVECNGVLCVGMAREYSVVSIVDGDAKSLLGLNGEEPALAYFDHEAYLRLNNVLLVTPIRTMPTSSKQALRRTIPFEHRPSAFTVRHGLVFAFAKDGCEVYSTYDDDVIQRVPVEDARFVSDRSFKDMIVCASRKHLWLVFLYDLRSRLLEMVSRYRVDDAHDLLLRSGDAPRLEAELKVASGFAHLKHGAPAEAMGYFSSLVDVREVLRYVPGLRPPVFLPPSTTASGGGGERAAIEAAVCQRVPGTHVDDAAVKDFLNHAQHPALAAALGPPESAESEEDFWVAWRVHQLHDPEIVTLEDTWTAYFAGLPEVAADGSAASPTAATSTASVPPESPAAGASVCRSWHGRPVTKAQCLRAMGVDLRRCLTEWLEARLLADAATGGADSEAMRMRPSERRAAEYAYLVLALDARDSVRIDRLLSVIEPRCLQVRDVLGVLVTRRHYRVLCGILRRTAGFEAAADAVYAAYVSQSATLERTSRFGVALTNAAALDAVLGPGAAERLSAARRGQPLDLSKGAPVWPGPASGSRHPLLFCPPGRFAVGTGRGVLTPPMSPHGGASAALGTDGATIVVQPPALTMPAAVVETVADAPAASSEKPATQHVDPQPPAVTAAPPPASSAAEQPVADSPPAVPSPTPAAAADEQGGGEGNKDSVSPPRNPSGSPNASGSPWVDVSPTPQAHGDADAFDGAAAASNEGTTATVPSAEERDAAEDGLRESDAAGDAAHDEPAGEPADAAGMGGGAVAQGERDGEGEVREPSTPPAPSPHVADAAAAAGDDDPGLVTPPPPELPAEPLPEADGEAPPAEKEQPASVPAQEPAGTNESNETALDVSEEAVDQPAHGDAALADDSLENTDVPVPAEPAPATTATMDPPAPLCPAATAAAADVSLVGTPPDTALAKKPSPALGTPAHEPQRSVASETTTALPPDHPFFIAAELARVSHVAHALSRDPSLLHATGADGATALHVALAASVAGPTALPPLGDVLTTATYLVSRGADVAAANHAGMPAAVVPLSRLRDTLEGASDDPATFVTDKKGWLPIEDAARIVGAVAAGAEARHPLPM